MTQQIQNPLDRWKLNANNQQELSSFLVSPAGRELMDVLRYIASPSSPLPPDYNGVSPMETRALQYSEVVGYNNCINNIFNLTTPATSTAPLPGAWMGTRYQNPQLKNDNGD